MENEQRHYELRSGSRSRSQTPLVQSRCLLEPEILDHHYDLRARSREGSHIIGDAARPRRSDSACLPIGSNQPSDQNVQTRVESKEAVDSLSESAEKQGENSLVRAKKVDGRSERHKTKRHAFTNGQAESKDLSGQKGRKSSKNAAPHGILTSDYSSEEGDREDSSSSRPNSAHEIYKQAGDWWNVFPKTDYTYSERSQCRYEIAPGILAMPNMSRRSIHSGTGESDRFSQGGSECSLYETLNATEKKGGKIEKCKLADEGHESRAMNPHENSKSLQGNTHVEQHLCHREIIYAVSQSATNSGSREQSSSDAFTKQIAFRKFNVASSVDSDAELEDTFSSSQINRQRTATQRIMEFVSIHVVSRLRRIFDFRKFSSIRRRKYDSSYEYQRYGTIESKWSRAWRYLDRFFQYIYLFMVKVFFFDSWLLSRVAGIRRCTGERSWKVVWLALLPLLLLTGLWCLPHSPTLFLSRKDIERHSPDSPLSFDSDLQLSSVQGKGDDFESIVDKLNSRISSLEDRTLQHSNRLFNVSTVLKQLRESEYVWSKYNNEILSLEKGLLGQKLDGAYGQEIGAIKSQFERLKNLYSELRSCCNARANCVTNDVLEKRIEMVLTDRIDTLALKKGKVQVEVGEKPSVVSSNVVTDERVREIVKEALRVYDADKTGRVDYALESAGGQVISTRCTQRYDIKTRAFKLLAFTLYHENNNPRTVIQGNPIQPGACWAFQGFPGYLLIKLRSSIRVTGFTVEHAPKSILPNGEMKSAPKMFNVWGFLDESDPEPVMFGDYEFSASGDSLQYFPVQNSTIKTSYEYVELRVHSNQGQLEYTCLYRFRVHGQSI